MAEFYNPYQFIPVNGEDTPTEAFAKIKSGESDRRIRHDLWDGQRKSGRIVCSLKLETPTVVGNQHIKPGDSGYATALAGSASGSEDRKETLVLPYQLPGGEYAIPANSLRGMISSTAEALSQSALRVLGEKRYSVRKEVKAGLSAIGYIRKVEHGKGKAAFYLRPLTLPNVSYVRLGRQIAYERKWINLFGAESTFAHWLSAYIDGYRYNPINATLEYTGFLDSDKECNSFCKPRFYYAKLHDHLNRYLLEDRHELDNHLLYCKPIKDRDGQVIAHSILGQRLSNSEIKTQAEFDAMLPEQKADYVRGVLFVLGINGRAGNIPDTKHHERFIPTPPSKKIKDKELEIPPSVIDAFLRLAQERNQADDALPYLPQGYEIIPDRNGWLCNGDMVYFDINDQGQVTEISYSSIWRKSVDGSIHGAFANIAKRSQIDYIGGLVQLDTRP